MAHAHQAGGNKTHKGDAVSFYVGILFFICMDMTEFIKAGTVTVCLQYCTAETLTRKRKGSGTPKKKKNAQRICLILYSHITYSWSVCGCLFGFLSTSAIPLLLLTSEQLGGPSISL